MTRGKCGPSLLAEYVIISGALFVISATDGTNPSYYTYNYRSKNLSGSLLFRIRCKLSGA